MDRVFLMNFSLLPTVDFTEREGDFLPFLPAILMLRLTNYAIL